MTTAEVEPRGAGSVESWLARAAGPIVFGCLLVFFGQATRCAWEKTLTVDEPTYAYAGLAQWRTGGSNTIINHLPLPRLFLAAPLVLARAASPPGFAGVPYEGPSFLAADFEGLYRQSLNLFFLYNQARARSLVFLVRLPNLLLGVGLGWLLFCWAREVWGSAGGVVAVVAYSFAPNLIGHVALSTPDLCFTAAVTGAGYAGWRFVRRPAWRTLAWFTGAAGLLLATKLTAVLLAPALLALLGTGLVRWGRTAPEAGRAGWRRVLGAVALFGGGCWLLLVAGYGPVQRHLFHHVITPEEMLRVFPGWSEGLRAAGRGVLAVLPLPDMYLKGLLFTSVTGRVGFPTYLNGAITTEGFWSYYLWAFALKTPLVFLGLLALVPWAWRRWSTPQRWTAGAILATAAGFGVCLSAAAFQLGLRYLLPLFPLLFLVLGGVGRVLLARPLGRGIAAALAAWLVGAALWISPHNLAYFNELAGGPARGPRYLAGSNLDWGQDLGRLGDYVRERRITALALDYHGVVNPRFYGIPYRPLTGLPSGTVAVSASRLVGLPDDVKRYQWLRPLEPVARLGYSIYVYEVDRQVLISRWRAWLADPAFPEAADGWYWVGMLHLVEEEYGDALMAFAEAAAVGGATARVWRGRGLAHEGLERLPEACAAYRAYLAQGPGDARIAAWVAGHCGAASAGEGPAEESGGP